MELIVKDKDKDESKTPEKKDIISLNVNEIKNVNDYTCNYRAYKYDILKN